MTCSGTGANKESFIILACHVVAEDGGGGSGVRIEIVEAMRTKSTQQSETLETLGIAVAEYKQKSILALKEN